MLKPASLALPTAQTVCGRLSEYVNVFITAGESGECHVHLGTVSRPDHLRPQNCLEGVGIRNTVSRQDAGVSDPTPFQFSEGTAPLFIFDSSWHNVRNALLQTCIAGRCTQVPLLGTRIRVKD